MKHMIVAALVILYANGAVSWDQAGKAHASGAIAWGQADEADPSIRSTGQETKATNAECALVANADDEIVKYERFADACPPDPAGKPYRWIPVVGTAPLYDPITQVLEGPTVTVEPTQVVREWTVRDKTAQELDDDKQAQVESLDPPIRSSLCDLHSRQSVQEGAGTKTLAECDDWLKGFLQ